MNRLMLVLLVAMSGVAHADVPPSLKDGTIVVQPKDGKSYTLPTNEYMIVKRRPPAKKKPVVVAPPAVRPEPAPCVAREAPKDRKNTVKLYGGVGPNGFSTDREPSKLVFSKGYGALFGFGYGRKLSDRYSAEAIFLSNISALGGIGWSF